MSIMKASTDDKIIYKCMPQKNDIQYNLYSGTTQGR